MKVHQRNFLKIHSVLIICLSALLTFATGCGENKSAVSESSGVSSPEKSSSSPASLILSSSSALASNESSETGSSEQSNSKTQNDTNWVAYTTNKDSYKLHIKRKDGSEDKVIVNDTVLAPCVAGEWVYYLPDLDEIDKVKLDGSRKTKVCNTSVMQNLNGNMAITAEYKDGNILYKTQQLHEVGNSSSYPVSYYKLDLNENKLISVKSQ